MGIIFAYLFWGTTAFGWGSIGHQVVGEIASQHLCPQTRRAVDDLLGGESLADAATWADRMRDNPAYSHFKPWHYVTMPLNTEYRSAPPKGDLISAYSTQLNNLRTPLYPDRAEALRLVVHLVGDAHQPFHAGKREDYGGNGVRLTWYGRPSNLHKVWDSSILLKLGRNFHELAQAVDSPAEPAVPEVSPEAWVNESSHLAAVAYPESSELGYAYFQIHAPVIQSRLREAGHRLAYVLNSTFGCR